MKIHLIYLSILVVVVLSAYQAGKFMGYWNQVESAAITGAIGGGTIELEEAKAVRQKDLPKALHWIDLKLQEDLITLRAYDKKIPAQYKTAAARLRDRLEDYFKHVPMPIPMPHSKP